MGREGARDGGEGEEQAGGISGVTLSLCLVSSFYLPVGVLIVFFSFRIRFALFFSFFRMGGR